MSEPSPSETTGQHALVIRAVLRTDVGLVRTENQDFAAFTTPQEEQARSNSGRLLIVADGMGGHRGGATASRVATETVKARYLESESTDVPAVLRESLLAANARIFAEAQGNPELRGMGTTTTALAVSGGQGWIAHVGDSRVYRLRDGGIEQMTADHSLVATMMREGLLTPEEAETHPRRNVLQRSMGVSMDVDIDIEGPIELRAGDMFVLCSDGLHGVVKEDEISRIATGQEIERAADELLKRALERGAPDNVTLIVARVEIGDGVLETNDSAMDETQPLGVLTEQAESADSGSAGESGGGTLGLDPEGGPEQSTPGAGSPRSVGGSAIKWVLLVVLVLGAAAAWLYWSGYDAPFSQSHSSSR
jgi:PPM family protein phosphatase